jgi:hypothetical protein
MTNDQYDISDQQARMCRFHRLSWTAVFVGALVGVGLTFLLNLFSMAIGLSLVSTSKEGMMSLAVGGFIGLAVGAIASFFTAGFAAGYLGRVYCIKRNLGVVYGFVAWCLALLFCVLLTANMGRYVAYYSNFATNPTTMTMSLDGGVPMVAADSALPSASSITIDEKQASNALGLRMLFIFILFFLSALASCCGGHYGMVGKDEYCERKEKLSI